MHHKIYHRYLESSQKPIPYTTTTVATATATVTTNTITTTSVYPDIPGCSTDLFQELHISSVSIVVVSFW